MMQKMLPMTVVLSKLCLWTIWTAYEIVTGFYETIHTCEKG